ncbi:MAG: 2-dehydropantoate 2-reductase [Proteobacteria bacterium]|nr:2-dehydropantoate 2-reductase [Pseudomonadota bacterium]
MKQIQEVWVVGAGALGSVLAALLHKTGKAQTYLVGASPHWHRVAQDGLRFETHGQGEELLPIPTRAWKQVPQLGPTDLVLLTGKATDLPKVAHNLGPKLGEGTAVFTLQNGLGVRELAGRLLGRPVEAGVAFFGARSVEPGRVAFYGPGRLVLTPGEASLALGDLLSGGSLKCEQASDYRQAEWSKLAVNCLANPLAGILNLPNHQLISELLDPAKEALLTEVKAVAKAEGIELELSVARFNSMLKGPNVPSLRTDIDRGRPSEIDFLNGAIVELAAKHGIPVPANQLVTSLIRFLTRR